VRVDFGGGKAFGPREGQLIDIDTGVLRRDRVLVQRTPAATVYIGFGALANRVQRFAFGDGSDPDPFFAECRRLACAIDDGYVAKAVQVGVPVSIVAITDPVLRRLAIAEGLIAAGNRDLRPNAPSTAPLGKASPDDPKHPGWSAGTPGGLGGKFRPKEGTAAGVEAINRIALRRRIRLLLRQVLTLPVEAAANVVPVLGEAADVLIVAQLAQSAVDYRQLNIDTQAALDFVASGPHALDDLRVSPLSESFPSYDAFYKDLTIEALLLKRFGRAGDGYQYHHIVEQGGANPQFSAPELQSTDNVIRLPTILHEAINSRYYNEAKDAPDLTIRQWLSTKSFDEQYEEGIQIMRDLGILQ
jgi:hypothetical protein